MPTRRNLPRLGASQDRVLQAIERLTKEKGYAPTVRELCAATGIASPSTVHHRLGGLEASGRITRTKSRPRTIVVVEP